MKYKFLSFLTSWSEFASLLIVQEKMQHRRKKKILHQSEMSIKLDLAEIEVPRLLFKREFSSHWVSVAFRFGKGVAAGLRERWASLLWVHRHGYLPSWLTPLPCCAGWFGFQGSMHECTHTCALGQTDQIEFPIKSATWINLLFMLLASKW